MFSNRGCTFPTVAASFQLWLQVSNLQNPASSTNKMESCCHVWIGAPTRWPRVDRGTNTVATCGQGHQHHENVLPRLNLLALLNLEGILLCMHPDAPLRRITTWLAIIGYALVASGLPLPLGIGAPAASDSATAKRLAGKDRSKPFPCMDKACGCATAKQCFTSCCCNTPAETLAWARAHHVEPAVLLALEHRVDQTQRDVMKGPNQAKTSSCCSVAETPEAASCCASSTDAAAIMSERSVCGIDASLAVTPRVAEIVPVESESPTGEGPSHQPRARTVTLRAMLACGGIVAEWFAAGAALPPPRVEVSLATSVLDVCTPADEAGECLRPSPAAPPPRAA